MSWPVQWVGDWSGARWNARRRVARVRRGHVGWCGCGGVVSTTTIGELSAQMEAAWCCTANALRCIEAFGGEHGGERLQAPVEPTTDGGLLVGRVLIAAGAAGSGAPEGPPARRGADGSAVLFRQLVRGRVRVENSLPHPRVEVLLGLGDLPEEVRTQLGDVSGCGLAE